MITLGNISWNPLISSSYTLKSNMWCISFNDSETRDMPSYGGLYFLLNGKIDLDFTAIHSRVIHDRVLTHDRYISHTLQSNQNIM